MRVLLATNGSLPADVAVAWLGCLPFPADREVMVVSVVPSPAAASGALDGQGMPSLAVMQARRLVDDTASQLLTGRRSIGRVVRGEPQVEIVASAGQWGADVVVLGTRGLGPVKGYFLTSVSLAVVRTAPCPVLVCTGIPRDVRRVTVALDGSRHARGACDWLTRLALKPTARIRLVGVVEPEHAAFTSQERGERLEAELARAARQSEARGLAVETVVATGVPATTIVKQATLHGSDLLVAGARGAGKASRLLLGSVSEAVLRRARIPVLVVRERANQNERA